MIPIMSETEWMQIHIRVPRNLLDAADKARGDLSRAAYVRRALKTQLEVDEQLRGVLLAVAEEGSP